MPRKSSILKHSGPRHAPGLPFTWTTPGDRLRAFLENLRVEMLASRPIRNIGGLIHERAKNRQERNPAALYTRFFRNPPQLEVLIHVLQRYPRGETVRFSVLGCSTGAEMYSALWKIGRRRPDLSISASGVDISPSAIETAKSGIYLSGSDELEGFGELFAVPPHCLFLPRGNRVEVNPDLRKGIAWHVEDARNPGLPALLGMQDIVFANNFLVHYPPPEAEACLSNILRLLAPGGFLFLWGVDPDVKARMVLRAGLSPCDHLLEEVYLADRKALEVWPWKYWGLEPLDRKRKDWKTRYATVFQRP